jgi:hypothetical protein
MQMDNGNVEKNNDDDVVDSSTISATVLAFGTMAFVYSGMTYAGICSNLIAIALRVIGGITGLGELWRQGIGFILKTVTDKVVNEVIETLKAQFMSIFDTVNQALGKTGDSINTTTHTLEAENIAREQEIAPDHCASDEVAINMRESYYVSQKKTTNKIASDTKEFLKGNVTWEKLPKNNRHWRINPSILTKKTITLEDEAQFDAYNETTLGDLPNERVASPSRNLDYEVAMISRKAKLSLLKLILERQSKRKLVTSGGQYSTTSLNDLAVQRTYGDDGSQWRKYNSMYAASTPLVKERAIEQAFNNHLKLNILRQEEDMLIANAIEVLELLENPAYKQKIYDLDGVE